MKDHGTQNHLTNLIQGPDYEDSDYEENREQMVEQIGQLKELLGAANQLIDEQKMKLVLAD
jgi:hypothetical protein